MMADIHTAKNSKILGIASGAARQNRSRSPRSKPRPPLRFHVRKAQHPPFQTHYQPYSQHTHSGVDLTPNRPHGSKIPKCEKVDFSIFLVKHIESSVQGESSSHPYYQIFCGRIPWSIPFLTHKQPHSYDTYTGLYPLSNLRVKSQIFKIRLFDIFKKHIRLKKNSATTKLFLIFVIILSTTTFYILRKKFHRLIYICFI